MVPWNSRVSSTRCAVIFFTAWAVVGPSSAERLKDAGSATLGTLSIVTEPAGATVYVDSRDLGVTPANLKGIAAGTHRLRLVKSGYLENSRILTVAAKQTTPVTVKLTRVPEASTQSTTQTQSTGIAKSKKWFWIGLAGGGAAAAAATVITLTKNDPPFAGAISVSPNATGMAGQTTFTMQATGARDPDDDPLTFSWNFGDGGSGSGESATHTYSSVGTFQVQLSVSDGKHTATAPNASINIGPNLTGSWVGGSILMPDSTGSITVNCGLTLVLTQSGMTLTGSMPFAGGCPGSAGSLASGSASSFDASERRFGGERTISIPGWPAQSGARDQLLRHDEQYRYNAIWKRHPLKPGSQLRPDDQHVVHETIAASYESFRQLANQTQLNQILGCEDAVRH